MKEMLPARQEQDNEPEVIITPDLDGLIERMEVGASHKKRWVVTSDVPSIEFALLRKDEMPEKMSPRSGLRVTYDMHTVVHDEKNLHYAKNIREYKKPDRANPPRYKKTNGADA